MAILVGQAGWCAQRPLDVSLGELRHRQRQRHVRVVGRAQAAAVVQYDLGDAQRRAHRILAQVGNGIAAI
jgi:hypothetical protein